MRLQNFCTACNPSVPASELPSGRHHGDSGRAPARLVAAGAGCRCSRLPAFLKELSAHLRAFLRRRLSQRPDEVEDLVQGDVAGRAQPAPHLPARDAGDGLGARDCALSSSTGCACMPEEARQRPAGRCGVVCQQRQRGAEARRDLGASCCRPCRTSSACHRVCEAGRVVGGRDGAPHGAVGVGVKVGVHRGLTGPWPQNQGNGMKTDELIHLLATDDRPVQRTAIEQRFAVASAGGHCRRRGADAGAVRPAA